MFEYLCLHSGDIASVLTIIIAIGGMIFWSHRKLHADIQEIRDDVKHAHQRIDAMGVRIDNTYHIIMEFLLGKK